MKKTSRDMYNRHSLAKFRRRDSNGLGVWNLNVIRTFKGPDLRVHEPVRRTLTSGQSEGARDNPQGPGMSDGRAWKTRFGTGAGVG